jgi:hypothetical protein
MEIISLEGARPSARVITAAYVVFGRRGTPCNGSMESRFGAPKGPPSGSNRTVTGYRAR